jgi:hypothetical protein
MSSSDTDTDFVPPSNNTFRGPVKLEWENGEQVLKPDLEAAREGRSGAFQESFTANKTLKDIISSADEEQFSKLENDDQKYNRVVNLVSGVKHSSELFNSRYVHGEFRSLKEILKALIDQNKIFLNPKDGNLYQYDLAIEHKLISLKCMYCSAVLHSEDARSKHQVSTHMSQRRAY